MILYLQNIVKIFIMRKELYYYLESALEAAEQLIETESAYIVEHEEALVDDRTDFDYISREMNNVIWSGVISAIIVRDEETNEDIAWFAYYTMDIPVKATWKNYNGNTEVFFHSKTPIQTYNYSLSHTGDDVIAYEDEDGIRTDVAMEEWAEDMVSEIETALKNENENIVLINREDLKDSLLLQIEHYTNDD